MSQTQTAPSPSKAPKRRKSAFKRIALGGLMLLLALVLIVALAAPMVASRLVPGIVASALNEDIKGAYSIDGAKISWGGPQKIQGVTLKDPDGKVVAQLDASADTSLFKLASGKLDLGTIRLSGKVDVVADKNGHTNLDAALEKTASAKAAKPSHTPRPSKGGAGGAAEPVQLPEGLAAKLDVNALDIRFTGPLGPNGAPKTVGLTGLTAQGSFANNQPVTLNATAKTLEGGEAINIAFKADRLTDANGTLVMDTAVITGDIDASIPGEYVELIAASLMGVPPGADAAATDAAQVKINVKSEKGRLVMSDPGQPPFARLRVPSAAVGKLSNGDVRVELDKRPLVALTLTNLNLPLPGNSGGSAGSAMDWGSAALSAQIETEPVDGRLTLAENEPAKPFHVDPATIRLHTPALAQGAALKGALKCSYAGTSTGEIILDAEAASITDTAGALKPTPGLVKGGAKILAMPTALLQPFVASSGYDLNEVLGPAMQLDLAFGMLDAETAAALKKVDEKVGAEGGSSAPAAEKFVALKLESDKTTAFVDLLVDTGAIRSRNDGVQVQSDALGYFLTKALAEQGVQVGGKPGLALFATKFDIPLDKESKADLAHSTGNIRLDVGDFTLRVPGKEGSAPANIAVTSLDSELQLMPGQPASLALDWRAAADNQPFTATGKITIAGLAEQLGASSKGGGFDASALKPDGAIDIKRLPSSLAALASPETQRLVQGLIGSAADIRIEGKPASAAGQSDVRLAMTSEGTTIDAGGVLDPKGMFKTTGNGIVATIKTPGPVLAALAKAGPDQMITSVEGTSPLTLTIKDLVAPLKKEQQKELTAKVQLATSNLSVGVKPEGGTAAKIAVNTLAADVGVQGDGNGALALNLTGNHGGEAFSANGNLTFAGLRDAMASAPDLDARIAPGGAEEASSGKITLPLDMRKLKITGSIKASNVPTSLVAVVDPANGPLVREAVGPTLDMDLVAKEARGGSQVDLALKGDNLTAQSVAVIDSGAVSVGPTKANATITPGVVSAVLTKGTPVEGKVLPSLAQNAPVSLEAGTITLPLIDGRTIDTTKIGPVQAKLASGGDIVINNATTFEGKAINAGLRGLTATANVTPGANGGEMTGDAALSAQLFDPADAGTIIAKVDGAAKLPAGKSPYDVTLVAEDTGRIDRWLGQSSGLVKSALGDSATIKASASQISSGMSVAANVQSPKMNATAKLNQNNDGSMSLVEPASVKWTIDPALIDKYVFTPSAPSTAKAPATASVPEPPPPLTDDQKKSMTKEQRKAYRAQREAAQAAYDEAMGAQMSMDAHAKKGPALKTAGPVDLDLKIDRLAIGPSGRPLDPSKFALGMNVSIKQLAFNSNDGAKIDLGAVNGMVTSAEGSPNAGVRFNLASSGSTKFTTEGTVANIGDASGVVTSDLAQITSSTNGSLPTALVDALAGQDGKLEDLLGPTSNAVIKTTNLSKTTGDLDATFTANNAKAMIKGSIANNTLTTVDPATVEITRISQEFTARYLSSSIPTIQNLEKTTADKPSVVTTTGLTVPTNGDNRNLNGDIRVDLGSVRYQTSDLLGKVLSLTGKEQTKNVEAKIEPFNVNIKRGVARYDRIVIPAVGYDIVSNGKINLNNDEVDIIVRLPAGALSADILSNLSKVPGLSNATMIPIRITGPSTNRKIGPDFELLAEELPGNLIGGLGGLIGGTGDAAAGAAGGAAAGAGGILGNILGGGGDSDNKDGKKKKDAQPKDGPSVPPSQPAPAPAPTPPPSTPPSTGGGSGGDQQQQEEKKKKKKKKNKDGKEEPEEVPPATPPAAPPSSGG